MLPDGGRALPWRTLYALVIAALALVIGLLIGLTSAYG